MYERKNISWLKHFDFILIDILSLAISLLLASYIRFGNFINSSFHFSQIYIMGVIINFCVAFFYESYTGILYRGYLKEFKAVVGHMTWLFLIIMAYLFATQTGVETSRFVLFTAYLLTLPIMYGLRILLKKIIKFYSAPNKKSVLIVSDSSKLEKIIYTLKIKCHPEIFYSGIVLLDKDLTGQTIEEIPVVANKDGLYDYVLSNIVDNVYLDLSNDQRKAIDIKHVIHMLLKMGVTVHDSLFEMNNEIDSNKTVENFSGFTVLTQSVKMATLRQLFIKRIIDILGGLAGILVIALAYIFLAPIIYIKSPGPIFFSQKRIGKNGRKFKCYKFRSMYMDAEERKKEFLKQNKIANGLMFKMDDDPRIIKGIGHFIRKYSIDELPQLWNVLKGNMSLVGTRPPTEDEYSKYDLHHKIRLATKPGITGLWQVSGRSNIIDFEKVVALDAKYISEWTLGLDLKILLKTVKVVLNHDGSC